MHCALCESSNQAKFPTEMNIHFRGLRNIDKPGVLVFPNVLICLDCGFSTFTTPKSELALLAKVLRQVTPQPSRRVLAKVCSVDGLRFHREGCGSPYSLLTNWVWS